MALYLTPCMTPTTSSYLSSTNSGLGNALFQIASTYGIAKTLDRKVSYHTVIEYGNVLYDKFGYDHKDTILRNCKDVAPPSEEFKNNFGECHGKYDSNVIPWGKSMNVNCIVSGYMESIQYFKNCINEIKELFKPDETSIEKIKSLKPYLFNGRNTVSVHFRLDRAGRPYIEEYYRKAINYINNIVDKPLYIIFSDRIDQVNLSLFKDTEFIFANSTIDYLDLWTMSLCKHNICSRSTFSFWSSFLNENKDKLIVTDATYDVDWYENSIKL